MRILLLLIAASAAQAQPGVPTWTLSARPTLDIGSETSTHTQFDGVTGILRMPGGEIVVANSPSQELRVFTSTGAYVRTLSVNTPAGAMRALGKTWRAGDTVFAAEVLPNESSVWVFTLNGFVARRPVGAANAGGIYPIDRFPDGRFVVTAAPRRQSQPGPGSFIDSTRLGVLSLTDLASPTWIGWLRVESVAVPGGGRGRAMLREPYLYGHSVSYAVSGDRLWVGDSETGTITQHSSVGRGLRVFSAPTPVRQLDTALVRRDRARLLSDAMNWNDRNRTELFHPVPSARPAPRFARFLPGVNGEMWVQLYSEDRDAPPTFVVVDRSGTPIGRVVMPRRVRPLTIGDDDVLAVRVDEEGLEHVVRHTLRRTR
jgi:hypothetical protein